MVSIAADVCSILCSATDMRALFCLPRKRALPGCGWSVLTLQNVAQPENEKEVPLEARPQIVCLCGSARYAHELRVANRELTLAGVIVLAPAEFERAEPDPAEPGRSVDPARPARSARSGRPTRPGRPEHPGDQNADGQNADGPDTHDQSTDDQTTGDQATGDQSTQSQSIGDQSTDTPATDDQPASTQCTGTQITDEQKAALGALHLAKIDLADRVLVVNPGGYVGESTRREIRYAHRTGKPVEFTDAPGSAVDP